MKNPLFTAFFVIPIICNAQFMSEDFDDYSNGDILSIVGASNGWSEWNGGSGTAESCTVSSLHAVSGLNSGQSIGGNWGLWTWTDISNGIINASMKLFVPVGTYGGYIGFGDASMTEQPHSINILGDS